MSNRADPLVLSPVPAPATHPLRDFALALVFVVGLALTGLAALKMPAQPVLEFENRAITPWSSLTSGDAFNATFERAFGDRFGARNSLLRAHHLALVYAFGVSPAPNVLLGRDDWLYFMGEDGRSIAIIGACSRSPTPKSQPSSLSCDDDNDSLPRWESRTS